MASNGAGSAGAVGRVVELRDFCKRNCFVFHYPRLYRTASAKTRSQRPALSQVRQVKIEAADDILDLGAHGAHLSRMTLTRTHLAAGWKLFDSSLLLLVGSSRRPDVGGLPGEAQFFKQSLAGFLVTVVDVAEILLDISSSAANLVSVLSP